MVFNHKVKVIYLMTGFWVFAAIGQPVNGTYLAPKSVVVDNDNVFNGNIIDGNTNGRLLFGGSTTGEGMSSSRIGGTNNFAGVDIYTNYRKILMLTNAATNGSGLPYVGLGKCFNGTTTQAPGHTFMPQSFLHVRGSASNILRLQNVTGGGGAAADILFNTTSYDNYQTAKISAIDNNGFSSHLSFSTSAGGSTNGNQIERMRIDATGKVGIGGVYPTYNDAVPSILTVNTGQNAVSGLLVTDGKTTNGNLNGSNINLQTFDGYHAINFNGYYNGSDVKYNTLKNRWRIIVDQRSNFDHFALDNNGGAVLSANSQGNVAIGQDNGVTKFANGYKLTVAGKVICTELKVALVGSFPWPDYVFKKDYKLMPLESVEAYIVENQHLPEVPSEEEVAENGISTGEMHGVLLKKIEELTLYLIEQKKDIEALKKENNMLKEAILK